MIQDSDGKGYFIDGRYFPNEIIPQFSKIKTVKEEINENLDFNLFLLPDLLQYADVMDGNLYSIYKEAYYCISCGQYDAGILKLGQLLEITLKHIIFVKTNLLSKKMTFGQAIKHAWKTGIIEYIDFKFLFWFLNEYRNPYTHRNLKEILKDTKIPIVAMPTRLSGKEVNVPDLTKILKKTIEGLKNGTYTHEFIDAASDTTLACQVKDQMDQKTAIILLWAVTIQFEQLITIYLNQKCIDKHITEFGSPFSKLTTITIEEEVEEI
jgi:hypothetical protein